MRSRLAVALDVTLVICAVATSVAVVGSRLTPSTGPITEKMRFKGWKQDLEFPRHIGSANGPYRLVVWTDYQCPACKQFETSMDTVRARLKDSLTIVYRHLPLDAHPLAFKAAMVAECARAQGQFEVMHHALFRSRLAGDTLPLDDLFAETRAVNVDALKHCLADTSAAAAVRLDLARAAEIGLHATPSIQVGNKITSGGRPAEQMIALIRSAR